MWSDERSQRNILLLRRGFSRINFTEMCFLIRIFIGVIISRDPKSRMISRHLKLSQFFVNNKMLKSRLLREMIPKSNAIIEHAKDKIDTYFCRLPM